jgi:hemerythrin
MVSANLSTMQASASPTLLGYAPMDAVHGEFDGLVAEATACADGQLPACLQRLHAHLLAHFGQEDDWMRQTAFPAADCHVEEHGRVLASAAEVLELVATGRLDVGRSFVAELARWFPGHADYLDSALAAWLCKRQYGGKPVVLHPRRTV